MTTALPTSYIKSTVYLSISAFLALFSGYWLSLLRAAPAPRIFLFAAIGIVLWLSVGMLRSYVFWNAKYAISCILLDTLLLIIPIAVVLGGVSMGVIVAWGLLFLFCIASFMDGREEIRNVVRVRFMKVGRGAARYLVFGTNLFLAIIVILQLKTSSAAVSKPLLEIFLKGTVPIMNRVVPGFSLQMNAHVFLEELARSRTPAGTPATIVSDVRDQFITAIEESANIVLDPQKSVIDATSEAVDSKLGTLPSRQQFVVFIVVAGLLFSVLSGIGFLVRGIILFLGMILYQVLFAFNFFRIKLENQNKEVVEI